MSEINVQLKDGTAIQVPSSTTVAEALKKLDRDLAKQALAAKINHKEFDLATRLDEIRDASGSGRLPEFMRDGALKIEPVLPQTLEGLDVLRHSTAHLLAHDPALRMPEHQTLSVLLLN